MRCLPRLIYSSIFIMGVYALQSAGVSAETVAAFYHGKQMKMIIRAPTGSGYDAYGRLLSRHIINYIPGKPSDIIPINMPGGGGIRAANYVANVAPRDGTVLTIVSLGLPMYQALGLGKGLKANMGAFNWLGSLNTSNSVLAVWYRSPTKNLEDAKKRITLVAASGTGSASAQLPALYDNMLGTKLKVIIGYKGFKSGQLAMERGEVEAYGNAPWLAWTGTKPEWVRDKKLNVIIQVGLKKDPTLPHVPLLRDLATNPSEKAAFDFVSKSFATGWPFATGPGVPQDRVNALRTAFNETMKSASFLSEAKKLHIPIDPITGVELQNLIHEVVTAPKDVRDRVRKAMQPKAIQHAKNLR